MTAAAPVAVAVLLAASLAGALLPARRRAAATGVLTAAGAMAALWTAGSVLTTGRVLQARFGALVPFTGTTFRLDALSALFCAIVAMVAIPAAVYGIGYARHASTGRTFHAVFPLFILSMLLVPAAGSVTTFLLCWELMAVTSLVLIATEHAHREAVRSAATWYAVMTHLGLVCVLVALIALAAHAGGESFTAIRAAGRDLPSGLRTAVFLLAVAGFGSKAGLVPLHVWLPRAHPEAPSHVSALLSGSMVKMGLYGLLRIVFDLAGEPSRWWGYVLLALGIASALFGVLHAMVASDLKRLLAYSTSENAGLIVTGIGAAVLLASARQPLLASAVLTAALLHAVNHAAFKGLLFLGAGSVLAATGTRDLDRLGGLARRMPATAVLFAVGAMAVSAMPPLNGFVSEWLLLQGLVGGARSGSTGLALAMPVAVGAVALTTGLVAATFVKAFGTGFLAQPRSAEAAAAHEAPGTMRAGMLLLAAACVALGTGATLLRAPLGRVLDPLAVRPDVPLRAGVLTLGGQRSAVAPVVIGIGLIVAVLLLAIVRRVAGGRPRVAEAWGCGRTHMTARMEYTATSFAEPLLRVFDDVLQPDHDLHVTHKAESAYFVEAVRFHAGIADGIERRVYAPLVRGVRAWGRAARVVQSGSVHRYLAYAFAALLVVLVIAR